MFQFDLDLVKGHLVEVFQLTDNQNGMLAWITGTKGPRKSQVNDAHSDGGVVWISMVLITHGLSYARLVVLQLVHSMQTFKC